MRARKCKILFLKRLSPDLGEQWNKDYNYINGYFHKWIHFHNPQKEELEIYGLVEKESGAMVKIPAELLNFKRHIQIERTDREIEEKENERMTCSECGHGEFRVFITTIIDDARLYCTLCGHDHF